MEYIKIVSKTDKNDIRHVNPDIYALCRDKFDLYQDEIGSLSLGSKESMIKELKKKTKFDLVKFLRTELKKEFLEEDEELTKVEILEKYL